MQFTFRVQKNTDGEIQLGHKLSFTLADGVDALSVSANSNGFTPLTAAFRAMYLDHKDFQEEIIDYFKSAETDSIVEAVKELEDAEIGETEVRLMRLKFISEYGN